MIITTTAIKGGTGKTTTAAALAAAAARDGKHVLAIDIDPQQNLTYFLAANPDAAGTLDVLDGTPAASCIQRISDKLHVMAAHPDLSAQRSGAGTAFRLARALKPIEKDFDFLIIDTPPHMSELTYNAIVAADIALIPLLADSFSLIALQTTAAIIRQFDSVAPAQAAAVVCAYNGRTNIQRFMLGELATVCQQLNVPMLGSIRFGSAAVGGSQNLQRSIFSYAPRSKPAADYLALYQQLKEMASNE